MENTDELDQLGQGKRTATLTNKAWEEKLLGIIVPAKFPPSKQYYFIV